MWLEYVKKYREENGNTPLKTIAEDYRAKGFGKPKVPKVPKAPKAPKAPKVPKQPAPKACELRVKLVQLGYDLCKPAVSKSGKDTKRALTVKEMKELLTEHHEKKIESVISESPPLPKVKTAKKPKVAPEAPIINVKKAEPKKVKLGRADMSDLQKQEYDDAVATKNKKVKSSFEKAFPDLKQKPKKSQKKIKN